ncbi:TPA: hypothetical protein N0F65_002176, partial [Lagenidium giganteum]
MMHAFGDASGLKPNFTKSVALKLHPSATTEFQRIAFRLPTEPTRYLGIQVGLRVEESAKWDIYLHQLVTRLALASRKTTDVRQRAHLVRAIVIPKLTFVLRHEWP